MLSHIPAHQSIGFPRLSILSLFAVFLASMSLLFVVYGEASKAFLLRSLMGLNVNAVICIPILGGGVGLHLIPSLPTLYYNVGANLGSSV